MPTEKEQGKAEQMAVLFVVKTGVHHAELSGGDRLELRTHADIVEITKLTPRAVSRALKALRRRGTIWCDQSRWTLTKIGRMEYGI